MFRGQKVRSSAPRTQDLLSSMVLVVLCCGDVLLTVNEIMKKEGYPQILQEILES